MKDCGAFLGLIDLSLYLLAQCCPDNLYAGGGAGSGALFNFCPSAYAAFGGNACAVYVACKMVAVTDDEKSSTQSLGELTTSKSDQAGCPVVVAGEISYGGIRVDQEEMLDQEALTKRLDESLTFKASCTSILINGEAKVF